MNALFRRFQSDECPDAALESEFRRVYQEPRIGYMRVAFALGAVGFGAFLLMDALRGSMEANPVSIVRVALVVAFSVALAVTYLDPAMFSRRYVSIVNVFSGAGMLGAALLPIAVHWGRSSADIYWSVNSSLTTGAIVIYGFSRLKARNTAVIVALGCLLGISTVFLLPERDWYSLGRLIVHITIVNLVAFSLRTTIERRERQLFLLAKENLSRNVYAEQLERARARAEEGNAIKLRFLANMSHEFRTPMTGMLQTLELVAGTASTETKVLVDKAIGAGRALLSSLHDILQYTRWTATSLPVQPSQISLSRCLRSVVEERRHDAVRRGLGLTLRLDLAASEDNILVDRGMLVEAASRILDNALRFTEVGGIGVNVELKRSASSRYPSADLEISVTDSGIGIPAELHERVFAPFYQVDDASTRTVGGTGLGLAIARRLIDALGGDIFIDAARATGTTFRLRVPVEICRSPLPPAAATKPSSAHRPLRERRLQGAVLLVEDNELNAELVVQLLSVMGMTATHAVDGGDGHRLACDRRFDAVLMDCQMPRVDGYEATRRIRESERLLGWPRVPIVALTANVLTGERERCLAAGMDDYLAKPYTAEELYTALAVWLPESRSDGTETALD